ncbi:DNA topoisomerase IB [Streptomyces spectabilis]|uniref:DNA topoisomerase n=1 Tax=Streptomyces spectabilis TaxID=68270 RepID=A0A5P2XLM8_STRST|nr:DNA topoisomerase IB [Streptomyces spectabilis]MBB5102152.1 DNA topoisomerase IB [Streptomyces spectabilis]MCI3907201.1 DNA topoisomerase IB [Streptomyces spectabilis]QEV63950.1 DNA topoisomerase IB [Streptomyces spectabilis]GGV29100.1 DNA topoisomerase [Streptomyces spectabilis]
MRLCHCRPTDPGYARKRHGRGFRYLDPHGRPLRDAAELDRIKTLVIPPAWRDVWICAKANGHLQAVGTDAAGRRQYLYHPQFRAEQEQAKHEHVLDVADRLPKVREAVEAHLGDRGLTRLRVLATAVRLLDLGFFRVGSDRYADLNDTYGLTTLLREHTRCRRGEVVFTYPSKQGKEQVHAVTDPSACRSIVALARRRHGGERLFVYWERPDWHEISAAEVNAYLKELAGLEVTAKDFRTWHATVMAAVALAVSQGAAHSEAARRRAIGRSVREVATYLGNTPAVCRASYINPRVIELYEEGVTVAAVLPLLGTTGTHGTPATQGPAERAVLRMLRTGRAPGAK